MELLSWCAYLILRVYPVILRIRTDYHPELGSGENSGVLYVFWHGRQFLLPSACREWHLCIMTDKSWAGDLQTRILEKFGFHIVRGSSRRKGVQALLGMRKAIIERGMTGAFAADGPRGPIYRVKEGVIYLARKIGYPIVPVTFGASRGWIVHGTWDRYLFPMPFSRCIVRFGKPIHIRDIEAGTREVERTLAEMTRIIDEQLRLSN